MQCNALARPRSIGVLQFAILRFADLSEQFAGVRPELGGCIVSHRVRRIHSPSQVFSTVPQRWRLYVVHIWLQPVRERYGVL